MGLDSHLCKREGRCRRDADTLAPTLIPLSHSSLWTTRKFGTKGPSDCDQRIGMRLKMPNLAS